MSFLIIHYFLVIITLDYLLIICILFKKRLIECIFIIQIVILIFRTILIVNILTLTHASLLSIFVYYKLGLR